MLENNFNYTERYINIINTEERLNIQQHEIQHATEEELY